MAIERGHVDEGAPLDATPPSPSSHASLDRPDGASVDQPERMNATGGAAAQPAPQSGALRRVLSSAMHRTYRMLGRLPVFAVFALKLRNHASAVLAYRFAESGEHEENGEAHLVRHIAPHVQRFVDVGANIGDISALVRSSAGHPVQGLLFEPSNSALARLRARFGDDPQIELVQVAASDTPGVMTFYEEPDAGVRSSLLPDCSWAGTVARRIPVSTLDREIEARGWDRVDFLKVDAEGYDFHVIRGAERLLSEQRVGVLQFEYHWEWLEAGSTLADAYRFLGDRGYRIYLLKGDGLHDFDRRRYGEFGTYSNFVAVSPQWLGIVQPLVGDRI